MSTKRSSSTKLGQMYGFWTVISGERRVTEGPGRGYVVQCRCQCGTKREVPVRRLVTGGSKSCGCGKIRSSIKAMLHLHKVWCRIPEHVREAYPEWRDFDSFKEWALREGYKTGARLRRNNEKREHSPKNSFWSKTRAPEVGWITK